MATTPSATTDEYPVYFYDDANRLTRVTWILADPSLVGQNAYTRQINYTYDGLGRRALVAEYNWTPPQGGGNKTQVLQAYTRYVYDGMNVLQEWDGSTKQVKYTWAGEIGGLLARSVISGGTTTTYCYHYDGGGNVVQLTDSAQAVQASYTYDAFGAQLSATGGQSSLQPYGFSTKRKVEGTSLYDYGFRFYSPGLGRFITRDPIEEAGGLNLYGFVGNSPVNAVDLHGLICAETLGNVGGGLVGFALGGPAGAAIGAGIFSAIGRRVDGGSVVDSIAHGLFNGGMTLATLGAGAAGGLSVRAIGEGAELGAGRIFTHFTSAEGVAGITGLDTSAMAIGETAVVNALDLAAGNSFFVGAGRTSITEIGAEATTGALNAIGVFGEKQAFAIQMSEETLFANGLAPEAASVARSIYSIPASRVEGVFNVIRRF